MSGWSIEVVKTGHARRRLQDVRGFVDGLYGHDLHAKRVDALADATLGVMAGASLAVSLIGQALAQARGLVTKHAVKQVDRLLSNQGIDVWDSFARWVPHQIGARPDALVAMDGTDFDHDGQSTLVLSLVTGHGRAAPLLWLTVWKDEIATRRNDSEDACLRRLAETVPGGCPANPAPRTERAGRLGSLPRNCRCHPSASPCLGVTHGLTLMFARQSSHKPSACSPPTNHWRSR